MIDGTGYILLLVGGFIAGALNVIAGGGSFLTIPVFIFLGLPPGVANATNRVGILVQNAVGVWGFHRHGVLDLKSVQWAALPSGVGAILGTLLALWISDQSFKQVLAILMLVLTIWTLWDPLGRKRESSGTTTPFRPAILAAGFFVVGIYGGFVQAGVGFLILATTTMAGLDLVRGNAVKVLSALVFTAVALTIFIWQGRIVWVPGLVMAVGTFVGGLVGVRLTVLKGHAWVKGVVSVTIILFAIKLLIG